MINEDLLLSNGSDYKSFVANEKIFSEGETPLYYFQVLKGKVKINNYNDQGREFIHAVVYEGGSVVQTALFTGRQYPVNAVAVEECTVIRLPKKNYLNLLKEKPELYEIMMSTISENMYYKYIMMQSMSFQNPENKLRTLMNYLKDHHKDQSPYSFQIPFTRQQLASFTGLSVETVIRVTKNMEKNELLKIQNRKIFY